MDIFILQRVVVVIGVEQNQKQRTGIDSGYPFFASSCTFFKRVELVLAATCASEVDPCSSWLGSVGVPGHNQLEPLHIRDLIFFLFQPSPSFFVRVFSSFLFLWFFSPQNNPRPVPICRDFVNTCIMHLKRKSLISFSNSDDRQILTNICLWQKMTPASNSTWRTRNLTSDRGPPTLKPTAGGSSSFGALRAQA